MTSSQGYFLHILTGELIAIHEHATSVFESPEQYGLTREGIGDLSPQKDRMDLLEAVLLRGFARIRHRKESVSIEFVTEWLSTLETVAQAIDEMGLGDLCWLTFHQLATGESMEIATYGLRKHYETGRTFDLLRRVQMRIEPEGGQFDGYETK